LLTWLAPALKGLVPEKDLTDFARAVRANIVFPHEARLWAEAVFNDTLPLSDDARRVLESTPSDLFRAAVDALSEDMDFKSFANRVKQASGVTGKGLFLPLRAALTGQTFGPEMPALFSLIAYERARHRLTQHVLSSEID
jgi:nondiscriminating glutamyl-tRNA synthetase